MLIEGEPWFVGADVCAVLGIEKSGKAYARLADTERRKAPRGSLGLPAGKPMVLVSEAGLYRLVNRSDKPAARPFQDWVNGTVLPAIRRDGAYVLGEEKVASGRERMRNAMSRRRFGESG